MLGACAHRPSFEVVPGQPLALGPNEGLLGLIVRRPTEAGCTDSFRPIYAIAAEMESRPRLLQIPDADDSWQADPQRPNTLMKAVALRLPAGRHAFVAYSFVSGNTALNVAVTPWVFEITAGRLTYIGGIGMRPRWSRLLYCEARSGRHFVFFEKETDIPLLRTTFPDLDVVELLDRAQLPSGWPTRPSELPQFADGG
ncbi:hypothetical protein [Falsiroseomonas sp.]|uniref:hypothetical protein n=1 Tax=Falsiroseomonas sp. TaxID=2870721 RepID=UPI003F71C3E2